MPFDNYIFVILLCCSNCNIHLVSVVLGQAKEKDEATCALCTLIMTILDTAVTDPTNEQAVSSPLHKMSRRSNLSNTGR